MKSDLHTAYIRKSHLDGSKYLLSTKSRQKLIHRGVVEDLSMTKIPRWIKKLSTMYRPDRNLFDGAKKLSRFYQEKTQRPQWIEIPSRSIEKRRKNGSIEENLLRIYREVVELEEKEFFKKGKTHRDECSKQATQTQIQSTY